MNIDKEFIDRVLELKPKEKLFPVEALIESLNKSDKYVQKKCLKEANARLLAHRQGKSKGVLAEKVIWEGL